MREHLLTQEVRFFVPFTALDHFETEPLLKVGAQNFYPVQKGSFTGEIGFEQLEEFGVQTVLIGHSERRHVLGESQSFIAQKYAYAMQKGVEIVYCVGEPKAIREQGIDATMEYIWAQCEGIDTRYERVIVAYEPVWAIGTGLSASLEDIDEVLRALSQRMPAPLLYGGSVKTDNLEGILKLEKCSGVLVGTASWDEKAMCEMIRIAQGLKK